jgi:hypothetical protein
MICWKDYPFWMNLHLCQKSVVHIYCFHGVNTTLSWFVKLSNKSWNPPVLLFSKFIFGYSRFVAYIYCWEAVLGFELRALWWLSRHFYHLSHAPSSCISILNVELIVNFNKSQLEFWQELCWLYRLFSENLHLNSILFQLVNKIDIIISLGFLFPFFN